LLKGVCLAVWSRSERRLRSEGRNELFYRKGKAKLKDQLDVTKLLQMVSNFRTLQKTLYTEEQRFLLKLQSQDCLLS